MPHPQTQPTHHPQTIQIQSAIYPQYTGQTDRQTDRHTHTHARTHRPRDGPDTSSVPIPAYALLTIVSDADNNNNNSRSNNNTIHNHEVQYNAAEAATTMPRM